jgi:hypothetical protein
MTLVRALQCLGYKSIRNLYGDRHCLRAVAARPGELFKRPADRLEGPGSTNDSPAESGGLLL